MNENRLVDCPVCRNYAWDGCFMTPDRGHHPACPTLAAGVTLHPLPAALRLTHCPPGTLPGPDGRCHRPDQVAGVFTSRTPAFNVELDQAASAMHSLGADIDAALNATAATDPHFTPLASLVQDYGFFLGRFDEWYSHKDDFWDNLWNLSARSSLDQFEAEYKQYRQRFIALGGLPSQDLPEPPGSPGLLNLLKAMGVGTVLGVGAAAAGVVYLVSHGHLRRG